MPWHRYPAAPSIEAPRARLKSTEFFLDGPLLGALLGVLLSIRRGDVMAWIGWSSSSIKEKDD